MSVKDWRRKLLQMAAESIADNYKSRNDDEAPMSDIDKEVKMLLQRQDWLENMKQVTQQYLLNVHYKNISSCAYTH